MAFADTRTGWSLPGLAAAIAVHGALLVAAVSAFAVAGRGDRHHRTRDVIAIFEAVESPVPPPPSMEGRKARRVAPQVRPSPRPTGKQPPVVADAPSMHRPPSTPLPLVPVPPTVRAPSPDVPRPAPPHVQPATAKADPLAAYAAQLRAAIMRWKPRGLRKEGEATVAFTLTPTGQLTAARIAQSSGDVQLDRLALRMVRQAAPFAAPPDDAASLDFTIAVRFH
ncbi:TonB family protein [Altererythrobacter sp. FM1]|uniref:energy transducer TonB family protein n=1 Tax=Tsuneonella flava TaxID=2055955 RepID=UPI000C80357F|nr:energy transducer TonB [Tsuneonella flava]ROT93762.1 TonB family protein [Altererythrobacter sp. FM1]UBS33118.1 TonB family protein [Altererythrobacter sp. N1]